MGTFFSRARVLRAASLALLVSLGTASNASAEEAGAATSEASLYFSNGVDLLKASPPNYQDAYQQFLIAYEKSGKNWKVLGNLGLCAVNLERDGEAIAYYSAYLEKGASEIDAGERSGIEKDLLLIKGSLAKLSLSSANATGALTITVRREGSTAPAQIYKLGDSKGDLSIRAGSHVITAEASGKKVSWEVVVSPGEAVNHVFDFAEPKAVAVTSGSANAVDSGPETRISTLGWVGIGTGAVGVLTLGGGLVVGAMAKDKESGALAKCETTSSGRVCPTSVEADIDSAAGMASTANILLIAGGALAATGVVLFVVGGTEEVTPTSASLKFSPLPLPSGGGLFASGTF